MSTGAAAALALGVIANTSARTAAAADTPRNVVVTGRSANLVGVAERVALVILRDAV